MNVLDIGCGWGGMAIEIAKQTGANVKGITLSENQFATASKRAQEEGLSDKISFKVHFICILHMYVYILFVISNFLK